MHQAIQKLAMAVLKYHLHDPGKIRLVRSLLALLIANNGSGPMSTKKREGKHGTPPFSVGAVARAILNALLDHSWFLKALQPVEVPGAECTSGTVSLSWPLESFLPVFDCIHQKPRNKTPICGSLRLEVLLLIQTLLDIEMSSQLISSCKGEQVLRESNLMALLLGGYNATLHREDLLSLKIIKTLDYRICSQSKQDLGCDGWHSLRRIGYLWGAVAMDVHMQGTLVPLILGSTEGHACNVTLDPLKHAIQLVKERMPLVDHQCCAMSLMYYPENRFLTSLEVNSGIGLNCENSSLHNVYDPVYLLPFCQSALAAGWMGVVEFWYSGLLGLCLRASAAKDRACRYLANFWEYTTLCLDSFLYNQRTNFLYAFCREAAKQAVISFQHMLSFHLLTDKVLLLMKLIEVYLLAVGDSFPRLSSITAIFLAEASLQLTRKQSNLHFLIEMILQKAVETNCTGLALFMSFLSVAGPRDSKTWILEMLRAGMLVRIQSCYLLCTWLGTRITANRKSRQSITVYGLQCWKFVHEIPYVAICAELGIKSFSRLDCSYADFMYIFACNRVQNPSIT